MELPVKPMRLVVTLALTAFALVPARAERSFVFEQAQSADDWCRDNRDSGNRHEQYCEVRPVTIAAPSTLDVETSNGSIAVTGSSRSDVMVEARVVTQGDTMDEAKSLAKDVHILTDGGHIRATGRTRPVIAAGRSAFAFRRRRVRTPPRARLTGSASLTALTGTLRGDTSNGSVHATDLSGDVRLTTSNGSMHVALSGSTWSGAGLR